MGRLARRVIRAKRGRLEIGAGQDTPETRAKPDSLGIRVKPERPGIGVGQDGRETRVKRGALVTRAKRDAPVTKARKVRPRRVQQENIATQTPIRDE